MRLLCVHPGASFSTVDVYNGMVSELQALGVETIKYNLEERLALSGKFIHMRWREKVKAAAPEDKEAVKNTRYTPADVIYLASLEVLERALKHQVDGVLIFSGMFCHPNAFWLLRQAHIRTALLLSESPYDDTSQAKVLPLIDVAWTNERSSVPVLRQANPNVNYMPHGYNPEVHKPYAADDPTDVPAHDVVFVGSLFAERVELLSQVDWTGIDLGLYGEWSGLPSRHKLRKYVAGDVVDNRYAAALYRKAKIGLNLYRESMGWGRGVPRITHAESMNPRTLELAACGCFQISSYRQEIGEVLGASVPTFHNNDPTALNGLIRGYLGLLSRTPIDDVRRNLAAQALERVQGHTFEARARAIVDDLGRAGWPVPKPARELLAV